MNNSITESILFSSCFKTTSHIPILNNFGVGF
jgi:hypothetical protein